jgi:hypothetical protein
LLELINEYILRDEFARREMLADTKKAASDMQKGLTHPGVHDGVPVL